MSKKANLLAEPYLSSKSADMRKWDRFNLYLFYARGMDLRGVLYPPREANDPQVRMREAREALKNGNVLRYTGQFKRMYPDTQKCKGSNANPCCKFQGLCNFLRKHGYPI